MNLTCSRRALNEAVQTVARAAATQTSLPILNHILLAVEGNRLYLTATDSDLSSRTFVPVEGAWDDGITVPARAFGEILNYLPEGEINLELGHRHCLVLRQGEIRFTLRGLPAAEFPSIPVVHLPGDSAPVVRLNHTNMRRMLRQTLFAVGVDPTRVQYTGIFFEREGDIFRLVACDGVVRIAVSSLTLPESGPPIAAIVPHRAVQELQRILRHDGDEPVTLHFRDDFTGPTLASFEAGDITLVTRLIEGQFPPWRRVVPAERKNRVTFRKAEILAALRRMSIVARDDQHRVQFSLSGETLRLNSFSSLLGDAEEKLQPLMEGGETLIALDGRYLAEGIGALDEDGCHVDLTGTLSPCLVRPLEGDSYLYIQSPMHPR